MIEFVLKEEKLYKFVSFLFRGRRSKYCMYLFCFI